MTGGEHGSAYVTSETHKSLGFGEVLHALLFGIAVAITILFACVVSHVLFARQAQSIADTAENIGGGQYALHCANMDDFMRYSDYMDWHIVAAHKNTLILSKEGK